MKPLILLFKSALLLAMAFFIGAFSAMAVGAPHMAAPAGIAMASLCFIPQGNLKGSLFTITAADIVTEWGALYRDQGQNVKDILLKLMQPSVTAKYFPLRITNNTVMEKAVAEFSRVLQRFQKEFTPIGGTTFTPTKIPLYKLKIDLKETPDDLEESWLGFLASNNLDRKTWPFIKWYLMNALIQQDKDLETLEIYNGVPGTITSGTATAAGASLKGIKKQINEADAAGKLMKLVLGAPPSTATDAGKIELVEYYEDAVKMVNRLLRNELDFMFVSEDKHDDFRDGMRLKYNAQYKDVEDAKLTKMRNDNIQIVGLPSMVGSNKFWMTPEWNRQQGIKKPGNPKIFQVENVDRTVKAYTDWYQGFGFWIYQYVVSNDVELT